MTTGNPDMPTTKPLPDASWTIRDVMRHFPTSVVLFNDLGLDTCCGASLTLEAAARNAGVRPVDLLDAIHRYTIEDEQVDSPAFPTPPAKCQAGH